MVKSGIYNTFNSVPQFSCHISFIKMVPVFEIKSELTFCLKKKSIFGNLKEKIGADLDQKM